MINAFAPLYTSVALFALPTPPMLIAPLHLRAMPYAAALASRLSKLAYMLLLCHTSTSALTATLSTCSCAPFPVFDSLSLASRRFLCFHTPRNSLLSPALTRPSHRYSVRTSSHPCAYALAHSRIVFLPVDSVLVKTPEMHS